MLNKGATSWEEVGSLPHLPRSPKSGGPALEPPCETALTGVRAELSCQGSDHCDLPGALRGSHTNQGWGQWGARILLTGCLVRVLARKPLGAEAVPCRPGYHWHHSSATAKRNHSVQLPTEALPLKEQLYLIRKAVDSFSSTPSTPDRLFQGELKGKPSQAVRTGRRPLPASFQGTKNTRARGGTSQHATPPWDTPEI